MASQQAAVRPRFLLASMTRPAAASTAPTPAIQADQVTQPRPTFRPLFTQTFRPSVAQPQPQPQPQEPTRPPLQQPTPAIMAPAPSPAATPAPAPSASPPAAAPALPPAAPQPPARTTLSAPRTSPTSTILQAVSSSLVAQSPTPKVLAPSSSASKRSLPPAPPPSPFRVPTTVGARAATPTSSPTNAKPQATTPSSSPMNKAISHPPSPLTLPAAQLKSNTEKPEVRPKTSYGEPQRYAGETYNPSIAQNGKQEVSKDAETKDKGNHKKFSDSEDFGMRVITIAGENKGAIMELSPSRKKHDLGDNHQILHKKGNPKAWSDSENSGSDGAGSNGDGNSKVKEKNHKATAKPVPPLTAIMNNNIQGVNNSFLHNSSFTHHDPGVHLSFSSKANGVRGVHQKDRVTND